MKTAMFEITFGSHTDPVINKPWGLAYQTSQVVRGCKYEFSFVCSHLNTVFCAIKTVGKLHLSAPLLTGH